MLKEEFAGTLVNIKRQNSFGACKMSGDTWKIRKRLSYEFYSNFQRGKMGNEWGEGFAMSVFKHIANTS